MYIIVMNEDKTLVASKRINLYEGDNLADKLMFLLPQTYKEIELGECIVRLNYTDLNGEEISEILVKDEELYKDRLCYRYPVDSRFTEYYRDIVYDISFSVAEDVDGDGTEDDVLFHTENHMIRILPRPDSIVHEDPIQKDAAGKIQKEMLELEHRIIALEENGLDVKDVVKYTEQDLTEEQKIQARKNIDAISKDDVVVKQSDWNQNDETSIDYIKNRPFYENAKTIKTLDNKYLPENIIYFETEEILELPDVSIKCTDDGKGNVNIETTGIEIDDVNEQLFITYKELTVIDDNNGNITINV